MSRFERTDPIQYGSLIEMYKKFSVPKFQRPYSWEKSQLKDFYSSLIENDSPYFIGNIVCLPKDQHADGRLSIVDGQQRLTTISLLLAAIVEKYQKLSDLTTDKTLKAKLKDRKEYCMTFLMTIDRGSESSERYTVIELGRESYQGVYEKVISHQDIPSTTYKDMDDHQKRIVDNYNELSLLLENQLREQTEIQVYEHLFNIERRIRSLEFIIIVLSNADEVFSIFEGMNSTGLDLTTSDLLKNAVLKRATLDGQSGIELLWNTLEELFINYNPKDFPNFLRRWYMANEGYVSNGELFHKIKQTYIESRAVYRNLEDFLVALIGSAKFYTSLKQRKPLDVFISSRELRDAFDKFTLLNNDQVYTVLLAYYQFGVVERRISISTLKSNLANLWVFVFRSMYISISPSDYERLFVKHSRTLSPKASIEEKEAYPQKDFFKKLLSLVKADAQFQENIAQLFGYSSNDNRLLRYVLGRVMHAYDGGIDAAIDVAKPQVEHILPQSPAKWGLTKSEVKPYVNKLGNLTLLFESDNKQAADESFRVKADNVYNKSHFKFNRDIPVKFEKISGDPENTIRERSAQLANIIASTFTIKP